jgi:hypothetical protein
MSLSKIEKNGLDVYKPQCNRCIHYLKDARCKAFSSIIPIQILTGEHDHTKPFKGDNGIRFENKPKK